nr:DedA family protein [uncultured Tolumonas sp.]
MDWLHLVVDFVLHIDVHLQELFTTYGIWVYGILFLIIFSETGFVVTPFLPGDSLLFAAGALVAATQSSANAMDIHVLVALLMTAAVTGNILNYTIGHFFGVKLFQNPNSKVFRKDYLDKTHAFFEQHGGKTIIITRFVPIIRTFAPFVAGMGAMTYKRFMAFNLVGGALWVMSFAYTGYKFGELEFVKKNFTMLMMGIIVISLLPMVIHAIRAKLASPAK